MPILRFHSTFGIRTIAFAAIVAGLRLGTAMAQPNEDGFYPYGIVASGTTLLGTAWNGGANGDGTAWSLDTSTGAFTKLHDFSGDADGRQPGYVASSGATLYGVGITGGMNGARTGNGTIWSLDTSTGDFAKLHDLGDHDGAQPGAIALSGTTLLGLAPRGGANGNGTIWSLDTSTNDFVTLHDFVEERPFGFVVSGTKLYGTAVGGRDRSGMIWSLDTDTNEFTRLHEVTDPDGPSPLLDIVVSGTTLYGTSLGGAHDHDTIWSLDTNTRAFSTLHDFNRDTDGRGPRGIVISDSTLYGVAQSNGPNGDGTVWSLDTGTGAFTKLHDFRGVTDGRSSQIVTLSGTTLFGTAARGGAHGNGTIWSFDASTNTFMNLHDFSGMPEPPPLETVLFDDGQEHVLSTEAERVLVTSESQLDLRGNVQVVEVDSATLVQNDGQINGVPGAERGLILRNGAIGLLNSGTVNGVDLDAATLVLDGGGIQHWDCDTIRIRNRSNVLLKSGGVGAADPGCSGLDVIDSSVQIEGAHVGGVKTFGGASTVIIRSGQVNNIDNGNIVATDTTSVTVTGGAIDAPHDDAIRLANSATLQLTGGDIRAGQTGIRGSDESVIEIWGGTVIAHEVGPAVSLSGTSQLKVVGGEFEIEIDEPGEKSAHILAAEDSTVTIYGSNFNFPLFEPIQPHDGFITGTLADGRPINWRFQRTATATVMLLPFVSGDYALDGVLDVTDIDQQAAATRSPNDDLTKYDENDDGRVDTLDRMIWVHDYAATSFGDANLDGEFNSSDLVEVNISGKYDTGREAGWAEGDWNGDGTFGSADLVFALQDGGYEQGPRQSVLAVPEPSACLLLVIGAAFAVVPRSRRRIRSSRASHG